MWLSQSAMAMVMPEVREEQRTRAEVGRLKPLVGGGGGGLGHDCGDQYCNYKHTSSSSSTAVTWWRRARR